AACSALTRPLPRVRPPGSLPSPKAGCKRACPIRPHADDLPGTGALHMCPHTPVPTVRYPSCTIIQESFSMTSKIYVGNLPYSVTYSSLESNFSEFGSVSSAKVMMDRDTGRSKGFGFVEMASAETAQAAISALNGVSVDGRAII